MNFESFLKSISKIGQIPLPGQAAQFKMSPPFRKELIATMEKEMVHSKKAAVMVLFYPDDKNDTKLVLILRKTYKGVHSAQVGFPGGRLELEDASLEDAAVRETFEEIGVAASEMEVVKKMSEIYIPPSNFTVYPYLGIAKRTPVFIKQDDEVEDTIEVFLSDFLKEEAVVTAMVMTSLKKELEVPAYELNGHVVWGATAMMLSEVKDLLKTALNGC